MPIPPEGYRTLLIDPPWPYPTSLPGFAKKEGDEWKRPGSRTPYPSLPIAEMFTLPIKQIAADGAHLYLWTTTTHEEQAKALVRAWGFKFSTPLYWIKPKRGRPGFPVWPSRVEICLFCRRGTLKATKMQEDNVFMLPRGKHSAKPPEFRAMFAETSPGPRIELFARDRAEGWDAEGDEIDGRDIRTALASLIAERERRTYA